MIRSIHLTNWRSHSDSTIEFNEGTNLLIGSMGSGKSSVMDGISFALFGTFPSIERRKLKLSDLFRLNEQNASVTIEFEWSGSRFRVERKLALGKNRVDSEAEISKDNVLVDSGPKAVTEYVERLLSVDYDLFTRAIYSEQNNIDYFLTLDPRRRKQELDQLLGLDRFETARTNIISVINRLKQSKNAIEQKFRPEQMEEAQKKLDQGAKEFSQMQERIAILIDQEKNARESLSELEALYRKIKEKKEIHEKLAKQKISDESVVSQLEQELEGRDIDEAAYEKMKNELKEARDKKEQLNEKLKNADSLLSALSRQSGGMEARKKQSELAKNEVEQKEKELADALCGETADALKRKKDESEKEAIGFFGDVKSLKASVEESVELIKNLKPGQSNCPLCDHALGKDGVEKIISQKKEKIIDQKKKLDDLNELIEAKKREFSDLSRRLKSIESLSEGINQLRKRIIDGKEIDGTIETLDKSINAESRNKEALSKSINEIDEDMSKLNFSINKAAELLKKKRQLLESREKLTKNAEQLRALDFDAASFEDVREKSERSRIALEKLIGEKSSLEKQLGMLDQIIKGLKKELENFSSMRKEIDRCGKLVEQLSIYRNALLDTQTALRSDLTDAINAAMKEIWSIFYPYRNYPSIRLSVTDKDYLFEVQENNEWKALETIASGGERACAALTLRVALAMVLTPNLSWLILDEPTHNLDSEAINLLSMTLQTKVPEVVKQTFVITHEDGLMGADFASSYRLARDKGALGPTKAERI